MRTAATLLLLLIAMNAMSQSSSVRTGKWKIGLQFSTDFNQVPDRIDTDGQFGYYNVKPYGLNYTTGITTELQISQRWQFISGVMYSDKDVSGSVDCYTCYTNMMIAPISYTFKQRYMELPVLVRYVLTETKISLFTETGLNSSYLVEGPEMSLTEEDNEPLTKFLLGGHIGAGAGYNLGKGFDVNLNFSYRHSFTNFVDTQDFKLRSFSLTTALYYRL